MDKNKIIYLYQLLCLVRENSIKVYKSLSDYYITDRTSSKDINAISIYSGVPIDNQVDFEYHLEKDTKIPMIVLWRPGKTLSAVMYDDDLRPYNPEIDGSIFDAEKIPLIPGNFHITYDGPAVLRLVKIN